MNEADALPLTTPSSPYERRTRRLARLGAGILAASILLPQLWVDGDHMRLLWTWARTPDVTFVVRLEGPLSPSAACLLVLGVIAWVSASFLPLVRRGRWLVITTQVCLVLTYRGGLHSLLPGWMGVHHWSLCGALGLVFLGIVEHRRIGMAFCAVAGALLLGSLLWPTEDWKWPFISASLEPYGSAMTPLLAGLMVGAFGLGGLFLWLGFGRERSRGARRWAMAGIVVIVALSYVSQVASLYDGGLEPEVPQLLALAWNLLRWQLRGYGEALVLAVGAFAWIVGAREARAAESVFD